MPIFIVIEQKVLESLFYLQRRVLCLEGSLYFVCTFVVENKT